MNLLLDSHCFLWAAFSPRRLSSRARTAILDSGNDVAVSAVTFWELSLKHALGKLDLTGVSPDELPAAAEAMGFEIVSLAPGEAATFHRLPRLGHRDPFDRMLVWQAMSRNLVLATRDPDLGLYREHGLRTWW